MKNGLIFTNENCIGCNRCVRICCSFGATISHNRPDHSSIRINPERCINCGACIDVCGHSAREYHDDTETFFADLKKGEHISLLIAPSFEAKYPDEYRKVLGALKALGVKRMLPVSLGADICTWAHIRTLDQDKIGNIISQQCPAIVKYVEIYQPKLLQNLSPIHSPAACSAIYIKKYLRILKKI